MSNWHDIEPGGKINSKTGCVIVRKRNSRGKWNVAIAYLDVSKVWRVDHSDWPRVERDGFIQWCEIPE